MLSWDPEYALLHLLFSIKARELSLDITRLTTVPTKTPAPAPEHLNPAARHATNRSDPESALQHSHQV